MTRLLALAALAVFMLAAPTARAADTQLLLVHGYGAHAKGKDCNGDTFKNALRYYQDAGGRDRASMTTIGYYPGDKGRCDAMIGDGRATNDRPIQDIAADLANYIDGQGKPVDIVAHSMGGLITRVALLGSAQGWKGFPSKLDVNNVVTLSTPHRGVADSGPNDRQWSQMQPGSGFIKRLHEDKLDEAWAGGTDWSLVGSREDGTVSYDSAIDKGDPADQKFGYLDNGGKVTHTGVRTLFGSNDYHLRYASDSGTHTTNNGWSPLKTAFQAATKIGDGLPKGAKASHAHHAASQQLEPLNADQVREARRATRKFKDIDVALAAGYAKASECEDDPKYGGMGLHYMSKALVDDGVLDVKRPEVLVYQPARGGKLRLGAVEYFQVDGDQDLATDPDRPSLFGLPFDGPMLGHNPQMPIHYDLHAWLYRHNPAGMFAMWNPTVRCP